MGYKVITCAPFGQLYFSLLLDSKANNNNNVGTNLSASAPNTVNNNATNQLKRATAIIPTTSPGANKSGPPQIPWSGGSGVSVPPSNSSPMQDGGGPGGGGSGNAVPTQSSVQQSSFFHREFPILGTGGGSDPTPQYGPGPSLRPETKGSWVLGGGRGIAPPPPPPQQDERSPHVSFNGDMMNAARMNNSNNVGGARGSPPMGMMGPPGVPHMGGPPPPGHQPMMGPGPPPPFRGIMPPYVSIYLYFLVNYI